MKKRVVCFAMLLVLLLSGCTGESDGERLTGRVEIFTEDTTVLTGEVMTTKKTAADVIVESCQKQKIPYTLKENMFDNFGGIASTKEEGWLLYVNGALAEVGANAIQLEDGFLVEFKYVNYDEAFLLE